MMGSNLEMVEADTRLQVTGGIPKNSSSKVKESGGEIRKQLIVIALLKVAPSCFRWRHLSLVIVNNGFLGDNNGSRQTSKALRFQEQISRM